MTQKELTELLKQASDAYYNSGEVIMSDIEFDQKKDELAKMEAESGIIYEGSPTVNVGAPTVVVGLEKSKHKQPALSLDKVKYSEREKLVKWLGDRQGVMSWKMDGGTVVLTYGNGKLVKAVTRGDGEVGNIITHNAKYFKGVPAQIPYKGELVLRGEATMDYAEFERVNAEAGGIYENARNLATATIQMLDANESKKRKITFSAFELVEPGLEMPLNADDNFLKTLNVGFNNFAERMNWLKSLGFNTVEYVLVNADNVLQLIDEWEKRVKDNDTPTDGLVFTYNDLEYGWGLGTTGHHPRWAYALKWTDEVVETTITGVEWSVGKTGIITPVAEFAPVRLGAGSTITRASLHNVSIMKRLNVKIGAQVGVYLANLIIPQCTTCKEVLEDGTKLSTTLVKIPDVCPVCGQPTRIENRNGIETLHCDNPDCSAKKVALIANALSKEGLDVKGLSEKKISFLLEEGFVENVLDFYRLKDQGCGCGILRKETWVKDHPHHTDNLPGPALEDMPGWEVKSVDNLLAAIEASRKTTLQKFLYSLNIPLLGNDLSKKLAKFWNNDVNNFVKFIEDADIFGVPGRRNGYDRDQIASALMCIEGVGEEKAWNIANWAASMIETGKWADEIKPLLCGILIFPEKKKSAIQRMFEDIEIWSESASAILAAHFFDNPESFAHFIEDVSDEESRREIASIEGLDSKTAEDISDWLTEVRLYSTNNYITDGFIRPLAKVYEIIDEIGGNDVKETFDKLLDDFEPVDTEGHTLEGGVTYRGKEYFCHLSLYFPTTWAQQIAMEIYEEVSKDQPQLESVDGLTFVITGNVHLYKNRDAFKESVEARGGKVAGSVSKNTDYLVNNDITSTSGKNQKAKELNVPIISEDEFVERFGL